MHLLSSYDIHVLQPLHKISPVKIQKHHPKDLEAKFQDLITHNQSWYNLLLAINFNADDDLPFTDVFIMPIITPHDLAKSTLLDGSSTYIQKITTKFQDSEMARIAKLEEEKAQEVRWAKKANEKAEKELREKEAEQRAAALQVKEKLKNRG